MKYPNTCMYWKTIAKVSTRERRKCESIQEQMQKSAEYDVETINYLWRDCYEDTRHAASTSSILHEECRNASFMQMSAGWKKFWCIYIRKRWANPHSPLTIPFNIFIHLKIYVHIFLQCINLNPKGNDTIFDWLINCL